MRALLRDLARHREERAKRGQILVMFGLGLIVFLGFAALTIDIGYLLVSQRNYQNAADEAALAGAAYLTRPIADPCADVSGGGSKHACARASAWRYLRDDLGLAIDDAFIDGTLRGSNTPAAGQLVSTTDGGFDYRLWVSTPPNGAGTSASMSTVGTNRQVLFVRVDRVRSPFIIGVLGVGDLNVSAWATAGVIPERYAVITLRRGRGGTETDPGPANTTNIKLAGNGSKLTVVDGDVGGNWGMKLTADSRLELRSVGDDVVNVRLIDHQSCGNSCWSSGQIYDANGAREPDRLPQWIPDPNYAPPTITAATWPNGLVDNAGSIPDIPNGDTGSPSGSPPNITIDAGTVTSTGTCVGPSGDDSDAPRLGPGTYRDLRVRNNGCVILDPVWRYTDPEAGIPGGRTGVPTGQYPGVYYFTGDINIDNSGLIVGDGVTVIMRPTGKFSPNSGGVMDLNNGKANGGTPLKLGAWTTKGDSPYGVSGASWMYQTAQEADPRTYGVGIALYILKPPQIGTTDANGSDVIAVNAHAGLSWKGVTYAPNDNVAIAGQPHHDGIGQLISWTFTFNGGTNVTQTFDGPGDGPPYLIEPCVLVAGSCQ